MGIHYDTIVVLLCMGKFNGSSITCRKCQNGITQMKLVGPDDHIIEEKCDFLVIPLPRNVELVEFKIKKFNQLSHRHRLKRNIK